MGSNVIFSKQVEQNNTIFQGTKYPWLVRICHGQVMDFGFGVSVLHVQGDPTGCFCAGTLVAANYIVTAGHCLYRWDQNTDRVTKRYTPRTIHVVIGDYDTSMQNETGLEKILEIEEIIRHPNHDLNLQDSGIERTEGYDIAMLRLKNPVDLSVYTPACLARPEDGDKYAGKMGTAVGWGSTDIHNSKEKQDTPQEVQLPIAGSVNCPESNNENPSMLCAGMGAGGSRGTCHVSKTS